MTDPLAEWTGVTLKSLVAAFFGGFVSMLFVPGGFVPRIISFVIGIVASAFLSPYFIAVAKIMSPAGGDELERAVTFMTGLLGMGVLAGFYAAVDRFRNRASYVADKVIDKLP